MVHPALVRTEVVLLNRAALNPEFPPLWRGHRGLARELLLDVLRHLLQIAGVAQVDVCRHAQANVVVVEGAVGEHILGPAERIQRVRCSKFCCDRAGREGRDNVGGLAATWRRFAACIGHGVLQEGDAFTRSDMSTP